jgi:hypothetical protein
MATRLDVSALTLNPKEVQNINEYVIKNLLENPFYGSIFGKVEKVTMQQRIGFLTPQIISGLKTTDCTVPSTGLPIVTASEKTWNPVRIADSWTHCNADLNALFKPYFDKIDTYREIYDISGSDIEVLFTAVILNRIEEAILRISFLADTTVLASTVSSPGIITTAGNGVTVAHYNMLNGIWKQVFDYIALIPAQRVTITENANTTIATQTALASGAAIGYLDAMYNALPTTLIGQPNQIILATDTLFRNYQFSLRNLNGTVMGASAYQDALFPTLAYNGVPVVNMQTPVGAAILRDWQKQTSQAGARSFPNRFLWTTTDNLGLGTLNEADFGKVVFDYNARTEDVFIKYGFTLDAKIFDDSKIMVAY